MKWFRSGIATLVAYAREDDEGRTNFVAGAATVRAVCACTL